MIAMLGMYDMAPLQGANDRLWQGIRAALGHGPDALTRDRDFWEIWESPNLLFAQTCGLPFRSRLHGQVALIGTPDYDLPGCPPGHYSSVLVVHADAPGSAPGDFADGRFAYNEPMSQSGWAGPIAHLNSASVGFSTHLETGSHHQSAIAVANTRADLAGLDLLTWTLLCEHYPNLTAQLKVIDTTDPTPVLPYITAVGRDPAPIAAALRTAIDALAPSDRHALHLKNIVDIPTSAYMDVPTPPAPL